MNPLKAIIIDDEKHARESLTSLLELYCPEVKVLATAANIKMGKQVIENLQPDIVFLDIAIGTENGFDLVESLSPIDFHLIFSTAYSEFALKAFEVNAIHYLLKPIEPKQLINAIQKVKKSNKNNSFQEQMVNLFQNLNGTRPTKIAIPSVNKLTYLDLEEIMHIKGSGNYSTFYLTNGQELTASKNLKYYEDNLPSHQFFRSHQSHIINLKYVKEIISGDGLVLLSNGKEVSLTRNKKDKLIEILKKGF